MLEGKEWNRENVKNFIVACRKDEGIPMFKTRYAGGRIKVGDKNSVIGICWGGYNRFPNSVVFVNVPDEDIEFLERGTGDWLRLMERFDLKKELKEAKRHGIRIKGFRLPKILRKVP